MNEPFLCVCPHVPGPSRASDGQSIYVVETLRAIARRTGQRQQVIALRIGDEPARESGEFFDVERVEPAVPIPDVFALYEARCFPQALAPLARRALARADELGVRAAWVHGYECAPAAEALRSSGRRVVSVVHYLIADESMHSLAAGGDPLRGALLPGSVSRVSRYTPPLLRGPLVRASSLGARWGRRLPWPQLIRMQLERLDHERRLLLASDVVMAVGERFARTVRRHYPEVAERVRWCFAGGPAPSPRGARVASQRRRLLLVGRPTPQKGWDYAAAALLALEAQQPALAARCELEVIGGLENWRGPTTDFGSGVLRSLQALRHVRFVNRGRLPRQEVIARYADADAFLFPSVYEPFGLVVLEALAAGCPVLASDADGPADIVTPEAGWVVPFGAASRRIERLTAALVEVLGASDEVLARKGAGALKRLEAFSWGQCAAAHLLSLSPRSGEGGSHAAR